VSNLQQYAWPLGAVGEALALLAEREKLGQPPSSGGGLTHERPPWDEATLGPWLETLAAQAGFDAEPTHATYGELPRLIGGAAPAILLLPADEPMTPPHFLLLWQRATNRWNGPVVALLGPERRVHWVQPALIQDALCRELIAPHLATIQSLLANSPTSPNRRAQVERAVLAEVLGSRPIRGCWLLHLSPGAPIWPQARRLQFPATVRRLLAGFLGQLALSLCAWWLMGGSALEGHFTWGWLTAWALLLLTTLPFQWFTSLAQSRLAIDLGTLLKQRLLYGALQLPPEAVRQEGAGHFLGRVLAADAFEQLAVGGGFVALLAILQVCLAIVVLAAGAGGTWHAGLLGGWLVVVLMLGYRYFVTSHTWNAAHQALTNELVEQMVGHRTRLVQEQRAHWHAREDEALRRYFDRLRQADEAGGRFKAIVVRGWSGLGLGWLCVILVQSQPSASAIAISVGGILLAQQAFSTIILGSQSIVTAWLAWQEVKLLFQSAQRQPAGANPRRPASHAVGVTPGTLLLQLQDVEFRYRAGGRAILHGAKLTIREGDRLLLEGPSGGGKSTLAALLTGLRSPTHGTLLLGGLDQATLGLAQWRRRIVTAPQFHENHVLTGTLAFNLLMGRRWPPLPEDLAAAAQICDEVGLGDLLERMPAGLQQMVGESGWQLSHGERSRLYIARALLQQADLIILDESFGALDPVTLESTLRAVVARARTLLVIAHP